MDFLRKVSHRFANGPDTHHFRFTPLPLVSLPSCPSSPDFFFTPSYPTLHSITTRYPLTEASCALPLIVAIANLRHPPSANHAPYLRRRKTEVGDLQDPEPFYGNLPRYPPTLDGTVLSPCERPCYRKGTRTFVSAICNLHV